MAHCMRLCLLYRKPGLLGTAKHRHFRRKRGSTTRQIVQHRSCSSGDCDAVLIALAIHVLRRCVLCMFLVVMLVHGFGSCSLCSSAAWRGLSRAHFTCSTSTDSQHPLNLGIVHYIRQCNRCKAHVLYGTYHDRTYVMR